MERLYETIKPSRGIDYRYWGFGRYKKIIGRTDDPKKVNEENVLKLLNYLDLQEEDDLKLYQEDRDKLVKSLSEANRIKYEKLRKERLQTRLRRLQPKKQKVPIQVQAQDLGLAQRVFENFVDAFCVMLHDTHVYLKICHLS